MPALTDQQVASLQQLERDTKGVYVGVTCLSEGLRDFRRLTEAGMTTKEIIAVALLQIASVLPSSGGSCNYDG